MNKDRIAREIKLEWTVGIFMFLVILALGYFTIIIGSDNLLRRTYPLEVRFKDVFDLRKGDHVTVKGMTVGKVAELKLEDSDVVVRCVLDRPLSFSEDYRIEVIASSVLGGRQLRIDPGSASAPPLAADAPLRGEIPIDVMAEAGETVRAVRLALTEGGLLKQASEGMQHFNLVAGRLARGEGTVGALLTDDKPYEDLLKIVSGLQALTERSNALLAALDRGEGTLGQLLKDDAIGHGLRDALQDIAVVTARLRDGEGSLGKLVGDDALYRQITSLIDEIRATVDDFRESTPLTTVTTILFGAL